MNKQDIYEILDCCLWASEGESESEILYNLTNTKGINPDKALQLVKIGFELFRYLEGKELK